MFSNMWYLDEQLIHICAHYVVCKVVIFFRKFFFTLRRAQQFVTQSILALRVNWRKNLKTLHSYSDVHMHRHFHTLAFCEALIALQTQTRQLNEFGLLGDFIQQDQPIDFSRNRFCCHYALNFHDVFASRNPTETYPFGRRWCVPNKGSKEWERQCGPMSNLIIFLWNKSHWMKYFFAPHVKSILFFS